MKTQQGIIGIIALIIVAVAVAIGGTYWYLKNDMPTLPGLDIRVNNSTSSEPAPTGYNIPNAPTYEAPKPVVVTEVLIGYDKETNGVYGANDPRISSDKLKIIQVAPKGTWVGSSLASQDGKYVYYTLQTMLSFSKPGAENPFYSPYYNSIYRYTVATDEIEPIRIENLPYPYPHIVAVSSDNSRAILGLSSCTECDGGFVTHIIVNLGTVPDNQKFKNIGKVYEIKFTGPNTYQYSEAVVDTVAPCEVGVCYKAGKVRTGKF